MEVFIMMQRKQQAIVVPLIVGLLLLFFCTKKQTPVPKPDKKDQTIYTQMQETYAPMIKLTETINHPQSKKELKEHIMIYNDMYNKKRNKNLFGNPYQDLPFIQYKNLLDKRVKQLQRYLRKLRKKRNEQNKRHEGEIEGLILQLEHLNQTIITAEEYRQEKLTLAGQKGSPWGIVKFGLGSLVRKFIPV